MACARRGCVDLIILCLALVLGCKTIDSSGGPSPALEIDQPNTAVTTEPAPVLVSSAPPDDKRPDGLFAYTDPGELPQLYIAGDPDGARLPLDHTSVAATVRGHVARVRVSQRFINDHRDPIEVTYTFPLPENSAVDDMRMVIGDRVIESEVHTRDRARADYERARAAGHTTALLEQERPNLFTQSVANVAPGEAIAVEIDYLQVLTEDAGIQEFVFPMVVGPRFVPSESSVPDASRITAPIIGEGQRSGNDVSLTLDVDAGFEIDRWDAPTHTVTGAATKRGFEVRLADAQTIPNRDFVIRWRTGSEKPRASLFLGPLDASGRGYFQLLVQPPKLELDALVGRREMIFVIDRSGSMSGVPLALAKLAMREAIGRMRPVDTFDVVAFSGGAERLFGAPHPANQTNLVLAERFVDGLRAGGGTMMSDAIEAALAPELPDGAVRYVFFLTDGFIGNEHEIFAAAADLVERAEASGGRSRVFGIGIGSAPNRALIDGLSQAGDGVPLYVSNREHPGRIVDDYYRYVDHGVLEDMRVKWGGLDVESLYPLELPDLFASHTVVMHGRYRGKPSGTIRVLARAPGASDPVEISVDVSPSTVDDRILSTLWAREKIADLTAMTWTMDLAGAEAEREITQLGLEHHLVTAYTSLVAVDRSRTVGDGEPSRIVQPIEIPEDVDPVMSGVPSGAYTIYDSEDTDNPLAASSRSDDVGGKRKACKRGPDGACETKKPERAVQFSVGRLNASEGVDVSEIERALLGQRDAFERCYLDAALSGKRRIVFRISFDADRKISFISVKADRLDSDAAKSCLMRALHKTSWKGLPNAESVVEVQLDLRGR